MMTQANAEKRIRKFFFTLIFVLPLCSHAQSAVQAGYSTQTLREPVFDAARVLADSVAFNNWLVSNYTRLSYEQMKGPREHLYYLIDSRVKDNFAKTGKIWPEKNDPVLADLFLWAEPLGVYGGSLIYNKLRSKQFPEKPARLQIPEGMTLGLKDDLLSVNSAAGKWSVDFPYYFMLSKVADFTAANGLRTQLLSLSTGATRDKSELGYSQASLMFIFSPEADPAVFTSSWQKLLHIETDAQTKDLGVKGLRSQYRYDEKTKLHTEFVSWHESHGSFAVAYLGIDGTYQWNRIHFINFLNAIRSR